MSLYSRYVLPRLIDLSMRNRVVQAERAKLVPLATGVVLEIGIGSALNLPFYAPKVERVYGVDPSPELWRIGRRRAEAAPFPVEYFQCSAERLPFDDATVDSAVSTGTLCTIPDPCAALEEVRRVLKPEGQLFFIEHGWAPEPRVRTWQNRLTPVWRRVAGGCHLNRKIDDLICGAGLEIVRIETRYAAGPKPFAYLYSGVARRAA